MTGTSMQRVPYRGTGPVMIDLLAGQVQAYFTSTVGSLPYIRDGADGPRHLSPAPSPGNRALQSSGSNDYLNGPQPEELAMDDKTRTELEAAAFRRLLDHLRSRTDVQNIDMMNLAGFCRNCLVELDEGRRRRQGRADEQGKSREAIYGMPFEEWKAKYQKEARPTEGGVRKGKPQALSAKHVPL